MRITLANIMFCLCSGIASGSSGSLSEGSSSITVKQVISYHEGMQSEHRSKWVCILDAIDKEEEPLLTLELLLPYRSFLEIFVEGSHSLHQDPPIVIVRIRPTMN